MERCDCFAEAASGLATEKPSYRDRAAYPIARAACSLTGIDGAVLLDATGQCHAIGVILEWSGNAPGRSRACARYNSAVRYVQSAMDRDIATLGLLCRKTVVDLIPDLRL